MIIEAATSGPDTLWIAKALSFYSSIKPWYEGIFLELVAKLSFVNDTVTWKIGVAAFTCPESSIKNLYAVNLKKISVI